MQLYKQKIAAARKGHELLKRKADALKKKFKEVMKSLLESKKNMGEQCK
jgi:V-type H+-transporting ATPase subunit D